MLKPMGPYCFRSNMTAWKWQRPNRMDFILLSHSSKVSLFRDANARLIFAFSPAGGSFVILIQRFSKPMGMEFAASDDRKRRNWTRKIKYYCHVCVILSIVILELPSCLSLPERTHPASSPAR